MTMTKRKSNGGSRCNDVKHQNIVRNSYLKMLIVLTYLSTHLFLLPCT